MNTIKGIKALRLIFSRLSPATLAVAAIAPSLLMLLTGQLSVYFVSAWGAAILYLALEDAIRYEAGIGGANSLGMNIVHQAGLIALSLAVTLVSFKIIRQVLESDTTDSSVASSCLLGWTLACTGRMAFASYKGIEFSASEGAAGAISNHSEKTGA